MKTAFMILSVVCVFLLFSVSVTVSSAEEAAKPFADREELYAQFCDPELLKNMYMEARSIARWISQECTSAEKNCQNAREVLKQPFSQWNHLDGKNSFHSIVDCQMGSSVSHPNPALHKIAGKPLAHNLRDINGKLWLLQACDGVQKAPDGFWNSQYSSWCMSITGLNEIWILNFLIPVPGTDYVVLSHIPFQAHSAQEIDAKAQELNELVPKWAKEWASQSP